MIVIARTLSTFNLRLFRTIIRGFKKDNFCTYKDNGTKYFDTEDEISISTKKNFRAPFYGWVQLPQD